MNEYSRKMNRVYLIALIVAYVIGMAAFAFLKLLGLKELNEVNADAQESLLPLSVSMGVITALGIALLELKVFSKWKNYSIVQFVICKYALIVLLIITGCVLVYVCFQLFVEKLALMTALHTIPDFLETELFLSILLYLLLFSILLNMFITVYEYLGAQAIVGALLGRYDKPAEEDLTFLFIDLRSSTTIAERMGHIQYSRFIENSFQILTDSIYKYNATIYQFVGDEAVLLWPSKSARKTLAPVHFYFDFQERLQHNKPHFLNEFGEAPRFKAAIHSGFVTVTEIRTIKKDIVYHGDVLNTCARIMGQCSSLNKDVLISSVVAGWLQDSDRYRADLTAELSLKGKIEPTAIYELTPAFFNLD